MDGHHHVLPSRLSFENENNMTDNVEMARLLHPLDSSGPPPELDHSSDESASDDEDRDAEHDDQSNLTLLNSRERTRGRERQFESRAKTWPHIRAIALETAPTLLFTTVSMLFTGKLLERVSHWRAMEKVNELIIVIPVILNLKGNLEMNLSARLGTAANIGELDKYDTQRSVVYGNLLLLQFQATVVSFVATCVSFIIGLAVPDNVQATAPNKMRAVSSIVPLQLHRYATLSPGLHRPHIPVKGKGREQQSGFREFLMVASTSMSAACLSSLFLGSFMCFLVLMCRRFGRDPDNIAPPIASCLGDLITLSFFGVVSSLLLRVINTPVPFVLGILVVLCAVTCATFTFRNPLVRPLLREGWSPLFGAMVIEVGTGIVLDLFVNRYEGFALLAVAISSLPGNVGSILVSRLSTSLHAAARPISPPRISQDPSTKLVMITLLLVTLPVQILFLTVVHTIGWLELPLIFVALAMLFFCVAVVTSLLFAKTLTNFLWSKGFDPDVYALPVHSAVMDLVGQLMLVACFEIVSALGGRVSSKSRT